MTIAAAFKPLSKENVADVLDVSPRTIENWVTDRILPAPVKLGNRVYWHPNVFYAWLDQRLSAGAAMVEPLAQGATEPQLIRAKPNTRGPSGAARTELDKVRSRTQAQLDALMA